MPHAVGFAITRRTPIVDIVERAATAPLLKDLDAKVVSQQGMQLSKLVFAYIANLYQSENPNLENAETHYTAASENERTAAITAAFRQIFPPI
jgi:hypothetical protein